MLRSGPGQRGSGGGGGGGRRALLRPSRPGPPCCGRLAPSGWSGIGQCRHETSGSMTASRMATPHATSGRGARPRVWLLQPLGPGPFGCPVTTTTRPCGPGPVPAADCVRGERLAGTATPAPRGSAPPEPQQNCPSAALYGGCATAARPQRLGPPLITVKSWDASLDGAWTPAQRQVGQRPSVATLPCHTQ